MEFPHSPFCVAISMLLYAQRRPGHPAAAPMEASRLERGRLAAQFEQRMLQVLTAEQQMRWKAETDGPRPAED